MKWQEVDFLLNDFWCTVVYDTPQSPGVVNRVDGKIHCNTIGQYPTLEVSNGVMDPPPWATVIVHTPSIGWTEKKERGFY